MFLEYLLSWYEQVYKGACVTAWVGGRHCIYFDDHGNESKGFVQVSARGVSTRRSMI